MNGSKMWITNSYEADVFLVFANVDLSKGYKGITCFIVEKDMGVKIAKKEIKVRWLHDMVDLERVRLELTPFTTSARHPRFIYLRIKLRRCGGPRREYSRRGGQRIQIRHRRAK